MATPTLAGYLAYRGEDDAPKVPADELTRVLAVEVQAQARVCRLPAGELPADLEEAVYRRTSCNLARRGLPTALANVGDMPATVPGDDPEVRRIERPFRRGLRPVVGGAS